MPRFGILRKRIKRLNQRSWAERRKGREIQDKGNYYLISNATAPEGHRTLKVTSGKDLRVTKDKRKK
jgi:hypothetical protein